MKKLSFFAFIATSLLALGSLTSCHDEDLDVSPAALEEHAFEQGFIKEFGKPSANQSWDFYAQLMESLRQEGAATRAVSDNQVIVSDDIGQPSSQWFTNTIAQANAALQNRRNNANVGQQSYNLVSTGRFQIYAVHYGGYIESNHGGGNKNSSGFEFGIGWDTEGAQGNVVEHEKKIFGAYGTEDTNPGFGADVDFPVGESFYFYIKYTLNERFAGNWHELKRKFYTNKTPGGQIHNNGHNEDNDNSQYASFNGYVGASTLLYNMENDGEQYMVIGFEDGWGYDYCTNYASSNYDNPDFDFNDIIFVLAGKLPVASPKRFFCEDRTSYDWDYNDVVFDVTSRGIVLRAVGGTLPVRLQITEKGGNTVTTGELHELMWSKQPKDEKDKHPIITCNIGGKTYYKPIRVGADPGLSLEAVQLLDYTWDFTDMTGQGNGKALTDEEIIAFANPLATKKVGDIKLIVGPRPGDIVQETKSDKVQVEENKDYQVVDNSEFQVIDFPEPGKAPAIWAAPVSVQWMRELKKISLSYPKFYGGTGSLDPAYGTTMWWDVVQNQDLLYQFSGDYDPDRVPFVPRTGN